MSSVLNFRDREIDRQERPLSVVYSLERGINCQDREERKVL